MAFDSLLCYPSLGRMHVSCAVVSCSASPSEQHPRECRILLAVARVHDLLNDVESATTYYKKASSSRRIPHRQRHSVGADRKYIYM